MATMPEWWTVPYPEVSSAKAATDYLDAIGAALNRYEEDDMFVLATGPQELIRAETPEELDTFVLGFSLAHLICERFGLIGARPGTAQAAEPVPEVPPDAVVDPVDPVEAVAIVEPANPIEGVEVVEAIEPEGPPDAAVDESVAVQQTLAAVPDLPNDVEPVPDVPPPDEPVSPVQTFTPMADVEVGDGPDDGADGNGGEEFVESAEPVAQGRQGRRRGRR